MAAQWVLKLYIMGNTVKSQTALADLRKILEEELHGVYELQIVDVRKDPALAERDKILAVPAVARILPPPVRKIIGNLSNKEKVLSGLDLVIK
jgi:circadian clock protein KaiB